MRFKQFRLEKAKKLTFADTTTIDLPESGILSAILCHVRAQNASAIQNAPLQRLIDHLTKIEITDGATKTMISLTGEEIRAMNFWKFGQVQPEQAILYGNKYPWMSFVIPFGRKLFDPKYAFNLGAWDDVDLEVTNDITTSYFQTDSVSIDVDLLYLENVAVPAEYLKNYEWKKEIADKDADYVTVKLPTTDLIRRIMIMTQPDINATTGAITNDPNSDNYNFKLYYHEFADVIYDHRPKDLYRMNAALFGLAETAMRIAPSTTVRVDTQLGYLHSAQISDAGDVAVDAATFHGLEDENGRMQKFRSTTGGDIVDMLSKGMAYLHTFVIPYDLEDDPKQYLNPAKGADGPVNIEWYAYKDDHKFRVCLEVPKRQGEA